MTTLRATLRTSFAYAIPVSLLGGGAAHDAAVPNAFRLCTSEIPKISAIAACMRKNHEDLSPACRAVFPN